MCDPQQRSRRGTLDYLVELASDYRARREATASRREPVWDPKLKGNRVFAQSRTVASGAAAKPPFRMRIARSPSGLPSRPQGGPRSKSLTTKSPTWAESQDFCGFAVDAGADASI